MSDPSDPSDRVARVALGLLFEPGDTRLARLVVEFGACRVLDLLREERDVTGVSSDVAARLQALEPGRDLEQAAAKGIRFVCPGDAEWPVPLDDLGRAEPLQGRGGPPLGLWVRGGLSLSEACAMSASVVGSRSATTYRTSVAAEIAAGLTRQGAAVVSGGAFGIDQAAHRGALAMRGRTVAVLACGVDRAYPVAHTELLNYIADVGAVVSELPPGCSPTRFRFLARNRLIAALSVGTVVVEAAVRSGALNTANWAQRLTRVLMGVPGPVTSAPSEGVHQLIRLRDAALVTSAEEVLEMLTPAGVFLPPEPRGEARARDVLGPREQQVLDAVPVARGATLGSVARTAGISPVEVGAALRGLHAQGFVEESHARWRLSAPPAAKDPGAGPPPAVERPLGSAT